MYELAQKKPSANLEENEFDLWELINTIQNARWLILITTILFFLLASAYIYISQPVYQANTLIQVEQSQNSSDIALTELGSLFNVESSAAAEMEILRSRLVVGKAVDELKLYIKANPDYLPILGRWLSKQATQLSTPGFLGLKGYVSGTESIKISTLEVPVQLEDQELTLVKTDTGYTLFDADAKPLATGKEGKDLTFTYEGKPGIIKVDELHAKPGARFILKRTSRLSEITNLQNQLGIAEKAKQSSIISATLEGTNPEKTGKILNAIGSAYVKQNVERKAAEAEKSLNFLDVFLPELKNQMQASEKKYTQFRDKHGTFDLGAESKLTLEAAVNLQTRLLELEQKRRELAPRFTESHPTLQIIDKQIAAVKTELAKIEQNTRKMPDMQQQLLSLMRDVKVSSEMYVNLLNSAQQLRLVKEGKVGNVRVVDPAVTPEQPIKPRKALIIVVGITLGVLIGISLALARQWFRPGIKTPDDIETNLGLHVFATIPLSSTQTKLNDRTLKSHSATASKIVLAEKFPNDPAIESLRNLRSALQFACLEATNNVVLITGPTPGIGKSFTTINFASVLGATGKKVLLVDADLRKGYLHQYFGLERKNGLSDLITKNVTLERAVHKQVMSNVDLITTGSLPPNPAELLGSTIISQLLEKLSPLYDYILVDTAPVLAVSDSSAFAPQAGTIFLVARAEKTTLGEIQESLKRLAHSGAEAKGIIFNGIVPTQHRFGSKYGSYKYMNYEYTSESNI